jgi:hypothetical protein
LITAATLKTQNWSDLAKLAKNKGLSGWQSMRKDQLVRALARHAKVNRDRRKPSPVKTAKSRSSKPLQRSSATMKSHTRGLNGSSKVNGKSHGKANGKAARGTKTPANRARVAERIQKVYAEQERLKDLSGSFSVHRKGSAKQRSMEKDRVALMVRDPYWLQVCWNVTRITVKRAEAALAEHWHSARPILRLLEVDGGTTTSTSERVVREIDIHGGVTNWYIDVSSPPQSFRVEIGYRALSGKFFSICRSNTVHTPSPDSSDTIDENWTDVAENYERVYAMSGGYAEDNNSGELRELFEENLRRPMTPASSSQFGSGAERALNRHRDLDFHVDAEMILYGRTKADAKVMLGGEPIKLRQDGSFTVRLAMPDKRQVLPVVASTPDGVEQRTIVIAVERNTKILEPMIRESSE